jgi:GT2 family glycosyltransferase
MGISVIIPSYNGEIILKACLSKNIDILSKNGITDIIIVDDASDDTSIDYVSTHFPQCRLVKNDKNLGFGKTCNAGAAVAKEDILLFLNNDMVFNSLDVDAVNRYMDDPHVFAISPPIFRKQDGERVNETPSKGFFEGGWLSTENDPYEAVRQKDNADFPILWACGGAVFMRKERFELLGGFDPMFSPFYCEDLDMSYQAWKRGWSSLYAKVGECDHQHQATIGALYSKKQVDSIHLRNKYLFTWKNLTYTPYMLLHGLTVILKLMSFQFADTRAILKAAWHLPAILRYRAKGKVEIMSDRDVLSQFKR